MKLILNKSIRERRVGTATRNQITNKEFYEKYEKYFDILTHLNISETNITEVPYLPKLEILFCDHTKIKEIPYLPNLKHLHCSNTNITKISYLPNLEYLYCSNCSNLRTMPKLPKLKILECKNVPIFRYYDIKDGVSYHKVIIKLYEIKIKMELVQLVRKKNKEVHLPSEIIKEIMKY